MVFIGCSNDDASTTVTPGPGPGPGTLGAAYISDVSSSDGREELYIDVIGEFGPQYDSAQIRCNGTCTNVIPLSRGHLLAKVPDGVSGTFPVEVTLPTCSVSNPTICSNYTLNASQKWLDSGKIWYGDGINGAGYQWAQCSNYDYFNSPQIVTSYSGTTHVAYQYSIYNPSTYITTEEIWYVRKTTSSTTTFKICSDGFLYGIARAKDGENVLILYKDKSVDYLKITFKAPGITRTSTVSTTIAKYDGTCHGTIANDCYNNAWVAWEDNGSDYIEACRYSDEYLSCSSHVNITNTYNATEPKICGSTGFRTAILYKLYDHSDGYNTYYNVWFQSSVNSWVGDSSVSAYWNDIAAPKTTLDTIVNRDDYGIASGLGSDPSFYVAWDTDEGSRALVYFWEEGSTHATGTTTLINDNSIIEPISDLYLTVSGGQIALTFITHHPSHYGYESFATFTKLIGSTWQIPEFFIPLESVMSDKTTNLSYYSISCTGSDIKLITGYRKGQNTYLASYNRANVSSISADSYLDNIINILTSGVSSDKKKSFMIFMAIEVAGSIGLDIISMGTAGFVYDIATLSVEYTWYERDPELIDLLVLIPLVSRPVAKIGAEAISNRSLLSSVLSAIRYVRNYARASTTLLWKLTAGSNHPELTRIAMVKIASMIDECVHIPTGARKTPDLFGKYAGGNILAEVKTTGAGTNTATIGGYIKAGTEQIIEYETDNAIPVLTRRVDVVVPSGAYTMSNFQSAHSFFIAQTTKSVPIQVRFIDNVNGNVLFDVTQ